MKILIIGKVWPEPASSAAGSRMVQLMEVLREGGHTLHFGTTAEFSRFSLDPAELGIKTHPLKLNDASFDTFIADLKPEVVIYDRFMTEEQFGWRVHEVLPDAITILNTEDLHFLRAAREADPQNPDFHRDETWRELAALYRCDLNLIISLAEMDLLTREFHFDAARLHYLPLLFEGDQVNPADLPDYDEREGFCTIGNMKHKPNRDSVEYLKKEIWPLIRKEKPDAVMHVYGAYMPEALQQLQDEKEGFLIHGRADSAEEIMKTHRVMLAPLRFGAGLKGKLLEAIQYGQPSVCTRIGAEGIGEGEVWPGTIADSPRPFARAAVRLYDDPLLWEEAAQKGHNLISEGFSRDKHASALLERLDEVSARYKENGKKNYIASMLRHQSMNATRFMAKWIEEKNKHR